jgi:hypothetical protein
MFTITAGEEQRCEALSIHFVKLRSCTVAFPDPDPRPRKQKTKSMFSVGVGACLIAARRMLTRVMSADEEKAWQLADRKHNNFEFHGIFPAFPITSAVELALPPRTAEADTNAQSPEQRANPYESPPMIRPDRSCDGGIYGRFSARRRQG